MIIYFIMIFFVFMAACYLTYLFIKSYGTSEEPLGNFCSMFALILWMLLYFSISAVLNN